MGVLVPCNSETSKAGMLVLSILLLLSVVYFSVLTKVYVSPSNYLHQLKDVTKQPGVRERQVHMHFKFHNKSIAHAPTFFDSSSQDRAMINSSGTEQTPIILPTTPLQMGLHRTPARGYVIAMKVWEQMTRATGNLLDLQCWAARHRSSVVEPYFKDSRLLFTFDKSHGASLLRLQDFFDMDHWRNYTESNGLALLVNQEEFFRAVSLEGHTWDVILVQMNYESKSSTCKFTWYEGAKIVGTRRNMKIVRNVCISATKEKYVSIFDNHIFGRTKNAIVIFNEWRGIGGTHRLRVKLSCTKARQYVCHKRISQRVLKNAEDYAQKYLGGFGQYVAIMARFEKSTKYSTSLSQKTVQKYIKVHIGQTLMKWKALKMSKSIPTTFLTFDYGKFGSDTFKSHQYYGSKVTLEHFHQQVYNRRISLHDWEVSFERLSNTSDNGYIALLQLAIATNARCIILVGEESNFLNYAAVLYKLKHTVDRCMQFIGHPLTYSCK